MELEVGLGQDNNLFELGPHQHYPRSKFNQLYYSLWSYFDRQFDSRVSIRVLKLV